MIAHIDLPLDDPIDCWLLVREIAHAVVPNLNPKPAGIECIVAKKPLAIAVEGIGNLQPVERALTDEDVAYLQRVLPDLPALQIPYSEDVVEAFRHAFNGLTDRPDWEPVLLDESRYLREQDRIVTERWKVAGEHLRILQSWLDAGRIRAFHERHVPARELLVGTRIPRRDVLAYLHYWEIGHSVKEPVEASTLHEAEQGEAIAGTETGASADDAVVISGLTSRSSAGVRSIAARSQFVEPKLPAEGIVIAVQEIPAGRLLSIKEVADRIGIGESTLHDRMSPKSKYYDPTLPRKIRLGGTTVRYSEAELNAWLQARLAASSAKS